MAKTKQTTTKRTETEQKKEVKKAIGIKAVLFWQEDRDGKEGYSVKYPDGYTSWCPKQAFEKAYVQVGDFGKEEVTDTICECVGAPNRVCASHSAGTICKWIGENIPKDE